MPRANPAHVSFSGGEVSPYLYGRIDLAKYQTGAKTLNEFLVLPQGPVLKRRGTRFITQAEEPSKRGRLIPFVFSRTDRCTLEFTEGKLRFIDDAGYMADPVGSGLLELDTPYFENELEDLSLIQQGNLVLITHGSHKTRKLMRQVDGTWSLDEMTFLDGPYLDANDDKNAIISVQITTNTSTLTSDTDVFLVGDVGKLVEFKEEDEWRLGRISAVTDGKNAVITMDEYDRVITFGENVHLRYHQNDDSDRWVESSPSAFSAYMDGGYARMTNTINAFMWVKFGQQYADAVTSASYGAVHVTLTEPVRTYGRTAVLTLGERTILATLTAAESNTFASTDVGRHIRLRFESSWVWGEITGYTSSKVVDVRLHTPMPRDSRDITRMAQGGSTSVWRLGAWSETTGYPACCTFFEQRAVFASTTTQPTTIWMSVVDDYENHAPTELDATVTDTNGIVYTIATSEVNEIVWLSGGQTLLIGTRGAEYQGRAASTVNEPASPRNFATTRQGTCGSRRIAPIMINAATLFISASGRTLNEMVYSFENDAFVTRDLTIFSEHILRDARQVVFHEEPHRIIWARLASGVLAGCTYVRDQEVVSWHRHTIASGTVESMCVIPIDSGSREALILLVNTGSTRQIEMLDIEFSPGEEDGPSYLNDRPFVDSYEQRVVSGVSTLASLSRFEGQAVDVVCGGIHIGSFTVSGGSITLPSPITGTVVIGLPYIANVVSLPLDSGSAIGTGRGKIGRIDQIGLVLVQSLHFAHRNGSMYDEERLDGVEISAYDHFWSGTLRFPPYSSYGEEQYVDIVSMRPYPLCIVAVLPEHKTNA